MATRSAARKPAVVRQPKGAARQAAAIRQSAAPRKSAAASKPTAAAPPPTKPVGAPGQLTEGQQALVDAALDVLQGSDEVDFSITEVVKRAGSNRAELYASFGSKDRLVLAAVAEAVRRTVEAVNRHLDSATGADAIEIWVRLLLRRASGQKGIASTRAFALDGHRLAHRFPDAENLIRLPLQRQLQGFLTGDAPGPPKVLAEAIYGMVVHAQAIHIAQGRSMTRREIDVYVDCALRIAGLAR